MKFPQNHLKIFKTCTISLCFSIISPAIYAQDLPPSSRPSLIDEQTETPTPEASQTDISIPYSGDLVPPEGADNQRFLLKNINFQGITVYAESDLKKFYDHLIDQEISLTQIYDVANRLNRQYRDDGYILTSVIIPTQTISNGTVNIAVIEGYIDDVAIEELPPSQKSRVEGFAQKIQASQPLNMADLERYLLLANDLAGIDLQAILGQGTTLGTSKLTLIGNYDEIAGYLNFHNRGTSAIGELRLQTALLLNSIFGSGESLILSGGLVPDDLSELNQGSIALNLPIGYEGLQLNLSGGVTSIRPSARLKPFDINGNTTTFNTGLQYPLIRSLNTNLWISGKFNYLDEDVTTNFLGTETYLNEDSLRVLRFGVNSDVMDSTGVTYGGLELSIGLDALGAKSESTALRPLSRANGNVSFTKLNLEIARQQNLGNDFSFNLAGKAQITSTALLASEQFSLGGADFGRAFDTSEILGDSGYSIRAELQKNFFHPLDNNTFLLTQPYVFVDYGQVYRRYPSAIEPVQSALASTGLGIRQNLTKDITLELELAFPIVEDNLIDDNGTRLFFSLEGFF